jgi:hypothetical protein
MLGKLHGIDCEFDVHISLHPAAAAGVDEFLDRLGDDGVAVIVEPVDQRADRRIFLILNNRGVVERADERSAALEFLQQAFVVDVETERLGGCIEVGAIDEERDLVGIRVTSKCPCVVVNVFGADVIDRPDFTPSPADVLSERR